MVLTQASVAGLLRHTGVHVVGFTDEEGLRFQSTFMGSRALVRRKPHAWRTIRHPFDASVHHRFHPRGGNMHVARCTLHF